MRTDDVVARVRAQCPGFQRVDHAMTSVFDEEADAPAAFVALAGVKAQPSGLLGVHSQMLDETVGVFVMLRRTQDSASGEGANDDLDTLRAQLQAALVKWTPPGADHPFDYAGGQLAERSGQLAWREDFSITSELRIT